MEREYMRGDPGLEGRAVSLWIDTTTPTDYPMLRGAHDTDVAVIGGGLVGVITAALLREAGKRVAIIEAGRVGCNASGHTTAKVTVQHGLIYRDLVEHLGELEALIYLEANMTGSNRIARLVERYGIACDYHRTPFCLYATNDAEVEDLRQEAEVTAGFGMPVTLYPAQVSPFPMAAMMRVDHQAQFHPLRFLTGLLDALRSPDLAVFENTRAVDVDDASPCVVRCETGEVRARHVVLATQFPFYDRGAFFSRLYPYTDYAFGVRLHERTAESMFHDLSHLGIRTWPAPGDEMLIVSDETHRTGHGGDERERYHAVLAWIRQHYGIESVPYHWSTEDYYTPDELPYVGASPGSDRVFLATGFGGWGMTNSAASAILMSDLILGRDNHWAEVFDPSRARPRASWRTFLKENVNVAQTLVGGKLSHTEGLSAEDLAPGEGAIVRQGASRAAAYRDYEGRLHSVTPTCTHLGCEVSFNEAEKTWDCPCHGSRYTVDGDVIHGPAPRGLRREEVARAEAKASAQRPTDT